MAQELAFFSKETYLDISAFCLTLLLSQALIKCITVEEPMGLFAITVC